MKRRTVLKYRKPRVENERLRTHMFLPEYTQTKSYVCNSNTCVVLPQHFYYTNMCFWYVCVYFYNGMSLRMHRFIHVKYSKMVNLPLIPLHLCSFYIVGLSCLFYFGLDVNIWFTMENILRESFDHKLHQQYINVPIMSLTKKSL